MINMITSFAHPRASSVSNLTPHTPIRKSEQVPMVAIILPTPYNQSLHKCVHICFVQIHPQIEHFEAICMAFYLGYVVKT